MHFITPLNLAFLSLLSVIILLYLLKLKRKEFTVPSVLLWQQAIFDVQANAPIQKLRKNLLLFLQLLILTLVVLGVARPYVLTTSYQGQNLAIILDASASMGATDLKPSRFERAKGQALEMVGRMSTGDKLMLIQAAEKTKLLSAFTTDKGALKAKLRAATVHDSTSNLREAVVLALSLIKGQPRSTIYLLSDGATDKLSDLSLGGAEMRFVKFGKGHNNVALTALDVRRTYTASSTYQVFVTVENFSDRIVETVLELLRNDSLVAPRRITVPRATKEGPGKHSELFENLGFESGLISAKFDHEDELAADNVAYAELTPRETIDVLLVANDNFVLERCLNVDAQIKLTRMKPLDFKPVKGFDVVIFDGYAPRELPDASVMLIDAITPTAPVTARGTVRNPVIVEWDRQHPVTRWLSLGDIPIAEATVGKTKDWGRSVVEVENGALVVAGEKDGKRTVWCGLDFMKSLWWKRPAFPIFIHNSVRWLASAGKGREETTQRHTGDAVLVPVPEGVKTVEVTLPDQTTMRLEASKGVVALERTDRVGKYELRGGNAFKKTVGISLLNKRESDIQPRDSIELSGSKVQAKTGTRSNREIWKWLILAALGVLCFEWYVYHRGV